MRTVIPTALVLLALTFLCPLMVLSGPAEEVPPALSAPPQTPEPTPTVALDSQSTVTVLVQGQATVLPLNEYLWGVVAAEMPASFELEALKAQAVTARTYTYYKQLHPAGAHPDAQVCDDCTCCQAYIDSEQAKANWGSDADAYSEKIAQAVAQTDGEMIYYDGQPIQALFFSSTDGKTQDAVAVWGNSLPYLQPVDSPEGADVPNYQTQVVVSQDGFRTALLSRYPQADLSGDATTWVVGNTIGGVETDPTVMRSLFDLRSASYGLDVSGEDMVFTVTGYGHGVGMSQYGANTLAQGGATYVDILEHYYSGVEVG